MADIVDTAINAGTFGTLVAAITAAGLDTALKSPGPFTVFAPTDEAFSKLPSGTVEGLLQDLPMLRKILEYHVIAGELAAADVAKLETATTTEGSNLRIDPGNGAVKINDATVVTLNIEAENGIIHAIDAVLLPSSISL